MTAFSLPLLLGLLAACGVFMLMEFRGLKTTLALNMKGDVKRETRWLAQYGQAVCTGVAALLVWQIDPSPARTRRALAVAGTVAAASVVAMLVKRLASRVRPGHEGAGKFLGPTLRHNNRHESFPSSHSAAAMALSISLSLLYPQAAATFWGLALACAALRYVLDAHWPSDVLAGIALGYGVAHLAARLWHLPIT
jgi:membrane-associated phospholipid phosphatase